MKKLFALLLLASVCFSATQLLTPKWAFGMENYSASKPVLTVGDSSDFHYVAYDPVTFKLIHYVTNSSLNYNANKFAVLKEYSSSVAYNPASIAFDISANNIVVAADDASASVIRISPIQGGIVYMKGMGEASVYESRISFDSYQKIKDGSDSQGVYLKAPDGPHTWPEYPPVYTNTTNVTTNVSAEDWGPQIALDGDGVMHMVYTTVDGVSGYKILNYMKSADYGVTWTSQQALSVLKSEADDNAFPSIAVFGDSVYIVFQRSMDAVKTAGVIRSVDNGVSWGSIENIASAGEFQSVYPSLCFDSSGVKHLALAGVRSNGDNFLYYLRSQNGVWESPLDRTQNVLKTHRNPTIRANALRDVFISFTVGDQLTYDATEGVYLDTLRGAAWDRGMVIREASFLDHAIRDSTNVGSLAVDSNTDIAYVSFEREFIGAEPRFEVYTARAIKGPVLSSGIEAVFADDFSGEAIGLTLKKGTEGVNQISLDWAALSDANVSDLNSERLESKIIMTSDALRARISVTADVLKDIPATIRVEGMTRISGLEGLRIRRDGVLMFDGSLPEGSRYTPGSVGFLTEDSVGTLGAGSFYFGVQGFSEWEVGDPAVATVVPAPEYSVLMVLAIFSIACFAVLAVLRKK